MATEVDVYSKYVAPAGAAVNQSVLTEAIFAYTQDSESTNDTVMLTLGSRGDIQFVVGGQDAAGILSIDENEMLNFSGMYGTKITGADVDNSVIVSSTRFTYDANTNTSIIDAGEVQVDSNTQIKRNLMFDGGNTTFTGNAIFAGSAELKGDFVTNGHVMSRSLNVGYSGNNSNDNISVGFGFRVTDKETLELYKYDASNQFTQRVAVFGDGKVQRADAYSNFPEFNTSISSLTVGDTNGMTNGTSSDYVQFWGGDGANIFYSDGSVIIGASSITHSNVNDKYDLEVADTAFIKNSLNIGDDGVKLTGSRIESAEYIQFPERTIVNEVSGLSHTYPEIKFNGRLSSIVFDELPYGGFDTNMLWWARQQSQIPLAAFSFGTPEDNNEFTLGMLYTGNGTYSNGRNTTWFDKPQDQIKLTDFDTSGSLFEELDLTKISVVEYIRFSNISHNFDGTMDTLYGFDTFSNEVNAKLLHNDTYSIGTLTLSNIATDVVPLSNATPINIGTSNIPFNNAFLETGVVFGVGSNASQLALNSNNELELSFYADRGLTSRSARNNFNGATIKFSADGITFSDGSRLKSAVAVATESTVTNNVDNLTYEYYNNNEVYSFTANVSLESSTVDVPLSEVNKIFTYEFTNESGIIEPSADGTYYTVNTGNGNANTGFVINGAELTDETKSKKTVAINLFDETGESRKKMMLCAYLPDSINDMIDVNTLVPGTIEFNQKFYADFNYFYNKRMQANPNNRAFKHDLPFGYLSGETSHPSYSKFIRGVLGESSTRLTMEYISYFDVPFVNEQTLEHSNSNYYCNSLHDISDRYDGLYACFQGPVGDTTVHLMNDGRLLPKIAFRKWWNDRNDTKIEIAPHHDESGWSFVNYDGSVNVANISDDWKKQLLTLTYSYVKYGNANKLDDDDKAMLDTVDISKMDSSHFLSSSTPFGNATIHNEVKINNQTTFMEPTGDGELYINATLF